MPQQKRLEEREREGEEREILFISKWTSDSFSEGGECDSRKEKDAKRRRRAATETAQIKKWTRGETRMQNR